VQGGVIITTSESKTNVMVEDGNTAVIGGLIKSSDSSTGSRVPFLGRIPILGYLFGYDNQSQDKRELIIFITPSIVGETDQTSLMEQDWQMDTSG
jgi:type II secretory pathway component GspD/PulD (secretin)